MKLFKISEEVFAFNYQDRKAIMINGIEEVFEALTRLGIPFNEIEYALTEMTSKDHNYAHFGVIRKSFIASEKI